MKSIIKITLFSIIALSLLIIFLDKVSAENNFNINSQVTYEVEQTGNTKVSNTITIENTKSEVYAKEYILKLNNIKPTNIRAFEGDKTLEFSINQKEKGSDITVYFDSAITGKGEKRTFLLNFDNSDIAVRTGEVWEISLPKIDNPQMFNKYDLVLKIPQSLGNEAYISPKPVDTEFNNEFKNYYFSINQIEKTGISAGFGKFQVFSFKLNYHLENESSRSKDFEIAIPPDTSLQRMHYQSIEPLPINIIVDDDGNWLATYKLGGKERVDVSVLGSVQIFSNSRNLLIPPPLSLLSNTKPTDYWQTNDAAIKQIASMLKTPEEIYNYVVKTLNYSADRVMPDTERLGAINALKNPDKALCMEFTDLFIAIARASGIPAREINGYAYTENPKIQPLSLVSDVLHSWPEYWDSEKNVWVSIDPTWANTSGINYFNKLDLRHFAFVIHGKDSTQPLPPGSYKLGNNPQKDVYVNFGQLPKDSYSKIEIKSYPAKGINLFSKKYNINILNSGTTAEYELNEEILVDGDVRDKSFLRILPPFSKYEDSLSVNYGLFASKAPENILVRAGSNQLSIPVDKNSVIIKQLILIFSILIFLVFLLHPKRPSIKRLFKSFKRYSLYAK